MASGKDTRPHKIDPSELHWRTPEAALRRLNALAELAGTDDRPHTPAPHPAPSGRELGYLLDNLLLGGSEEHLEITASNLPPAQQALLDRLIRSARAALQERQHSEPQRLLGFPADTRGTWANLLGQGWIPWQPGWVARLRD
jgi:hypothetical protein